MQNLSDYKKITTAIRMIDFLYVASKTTDKNLPLKEATFFIKNIYELLVSIRKK